MDDIKPMPMKNSDYFLAFFLSGEMIAWMKVHEIYLSKLEVSSSQLIAKNMVALEIRSPNETVMKRANMIILNSEMVEYLTKW